MFPISLSPYSVTEPQLWIPYLSNGTIFLATGPLCGEFTGHLTFLHKGQWRGALMFSLIYTLIHGWLNNREAGDLRHHRAHYDVTVMEDENQYIPRIYLQLRTSLRYLYWGILVNAIGFEQFYCESPRVLYFVISPNGNIPNTAWNSYLNFTHIYIQTQSTFKTAKSIE